MKATARISPCNSWIQLLLLAVLTASALPITQQTTTVLRGNSLVERRQLTAKQDDPFVHQMVTIANRQGAAGEVLSIGITFLVSSTSTSETEHTVNPADLQTVLEVFATTLLQEWDYRMLRALPSTEDYQGLRRLSSHRRRLTVTLVPESVVVSPDLMPGNDCVVSVSQGDGFPHCHQASGSFQVLLSEEETSARVCRSMGASVDNLVADDYLQQALDMSVQSDMILSQGAMEFCQPVDDSTTAPPTPAPTVVATTAAPHDNVFNHTTAAPTDGTQAPVPAPETNAPSPAATPAATAAATVAVTTAATAAATPVATTAVPAAGSASSTSPPTPTPTSGGTPAPSAEKSFVNEWLNVLNGNTGSGGGSGNEWLDTVDAATNQEPPRTETPAPAPLDNSNYTAQIEEDRAVYWDDSTLDQVIFVLLIIWASCFVAVCCCYWGDAAWIRYRFEQLYQADEEHYHDGRWYYDEQHRFPRADCWSKPPPGEFSPLAEGESSEEESEEEDEDSLYMSDSEEEDGFDFEDDHEFTQGSGVEESGDFYVDYDESEEDVDVFDESDGEEEAGEFTEGSSDFFKDEDFLKEQAKPKEKKG